jgi:archaellum component FlaG (FlaF/FlaG flagellin family)
MNNDQDVLLLESLVSEVMDGKFTLSEVTEEDSPNLPDDISQLKIDIQAIPGLDNVTTVKTSGGGNYSFYVKGVGDRDRKERREVGKKIIQGLPKNYIIGDNNFSDETVGPQVNITIGDTKYKINIKGLGSSPFDTDTDQKEGLVILMYNILKADKNLQPFNQ